MALVDFMIGEQAMQQAKKRTKWTEDEVNFLKSNHLKLSYNQIAKHLNRTYSSVNGKVTQLGIGNNEPNYKYTFKKNSLSADEFSGYIAGLWAADGTLRHDSNRISHKFHVKDSEYLKYIYSILINEEVEFAEKTGNKNCVTFGGTIPEFRNYLESVNITSRKTHTLNVNFLDKSEVWSKHFIAGYLDGDGWVYTNEKRYKQKIGFVSSGKILHNIQEFLGYGKLYNRESYYRLIFTSKKSNKLANYLKDSKYQFPRKKQNLNIILNSFGDENAR